MQWSQYNYIFQKDEKHYLYNFNTNALIKLDPNNLVKLMNVKKDPALLENVQQREQLIKYKIFIENETEEINNYINEVKNYRKSDSVFDVFIYPTLACNLECPYCFQSTYTRHTMDVETVSNTINFVSSNINKSDKKIVGITWIGGEPLLAVDKIEKIIDGLNANIKNIDNIEFRQSIVTNGVLLSDKIIRKLDRLKIYEIQLTIDGLFNEHDQRRPAKNNKNTFDIIIENIKQTVMISKKFKIKIRVNIDNNNKSQFVKIYQFLIEKFFEHKEQIQIYPGFITEYGRVCKSVPDDCSFNLSNTEKAIFFLDLYRNNGIIGTDFLPKKNQGSCMARTKNSYAIGPKGYIYKCATIVGESELAVGNVNDPEYITNTKILAQFLVEEDYLDDLNCKNCNLFMVCGGGCSLLRLKNKWYGTDFDSCHISKHFIDDFINTNIMIQNRSINNESKI
jgi:uncharacterized protein